MTVQALINNLQNLPKDSQVMIHSNQGMPIPAMEIVDLVVCEEHIVYLTGTKKMQIFPCIAEKAMAS